MIFWQHSPRMLEYSRWMLSCIFVFHTNIHLCHFFLGLRAWILWEMKESSGFFLCVHSGSLCVHRYQSLFWLWVWWYYVSHNAYTDVSLFGFYFWCIDTYLCVRACVCVYVCVCVSFCVDVCVWVWKKYTMKSFVCVSKIDLCLYTNIWISIKTYSQYWI